MVAEMRAKKIEKLAAQCLAKHPEMTTEEAQSWAKRKAHDWIVTVKMTDGNYHVVAPIIGNEATIVVNNDQASRRVFAWDKVEQNFLTRFPDYSVEIEE